MSQHAYDDVEPDSMRLLAQAGQAIIELRDERDQLRKERDADYAGMREFQAKFIEADQERIKRTAEVARLREALQPFADQWAFMQARPQLANGIVRNDAVFEAAWKALDAARKQG